MRNIILVFTGSLIVSAFYYYTTGINVLLKVLGQGDLSITLTSIVSIVYLSLIGSGIILAMIYVKKFGFNAANKSIQRVYS